MILGANGRPWTPETPSHECLTILWGMGVEAWASDILIHSVKYSAGAVSTGFL